MDDLREFFFFFTLLDTELKRTDVISGWNPSLVGAGRAEPKGTERGRMESTERLARGMRGLYIRFDAMFQPPNKTRASRPFNQSQRTEFFGVSHSHLESLHRVDVIESTHTGFRYHLLLLFCVLCLKYAAFPVCLLNLHRINITIFSVSIFVM